MTAPLTARKHPTFIVRQADPFNGGPALAQLIDTRVTPIEHFFVRSHGTIPMVNGDSFRLVVRGLPSGELSFGLSELRERFESVEVEATLQCAGNRRQELMAVRAIPGEVAWGSEAIGHARWTGIRVRDLLAQGGVRAADSTQHLAMESIDDVEREGRRLSFGGSIPLARALDPDVILAYAMNGHDLAPEHGFPVRVVVPGHIGARSVKWVQTLTLQDGPSANYFQAVAYRLKRADAVPPDEGMALGEFPLTSVICSPEPGARVPAGALMVRGYAFAGGERTIHRVDVSSDDGLTWVAADFDDVALPGAWRRWAAVVEVEAGVGRLCVRAIDTAGHMQPEHAASVWNPKGYVNNAWHRVGVDVMTDASG